MEYSNENPEQYMYFLPLDLGDDSMNLPFPTRLEKINFTYKLAGFFSTKNRIFVNKLLIQPNCLISS